MTKVDQFPAGAASPVRPVVLVVDDNPLNLELFVDYLSEVDCDVVVAANGVEALGAVANVIPDLVLLDVGMPGLDGYEVWRRLKANPSTQLVPVVLVASSGSRTGSAASRREPTISCPSRSTKLSWWLEYAHCSVKRDPRPA